MDEFEKAKRLLGKGDYLYMEIPDTPCIICQQDKIDSIHISNNEDKEKHDYVGESQKFFMKFLTIEQRIDLFSILRDIKDFEISIIPQLSKDSMILAINLGYESLSESPELNGFDEIQKKQFVTDNLFPILNKMMEINNFGTTKRILNREVVNRAKEMQKIRDAHGKPREISQSGNA
jgi:hypothetical protein